MAVTINPNYIDAAHDMYNKYHVVPGIFAVDTLDYNDPITGTNIFLDVFWRMKDTSSGPAEIWSIVLPRSMLNEMISSSSTKLLQMTKLTNSNSVQTQNGISIFRLIAAS